MTDLQALVDERNSGAWWNERAAESMPVEQPVYVWRCSVCGKWSHARKRPRSHQRMVAAEQGRPVDLEVIEEVASWSTPEGQTIHGGWLVRCGPFDTYEARRLG